MKLQNFCNKNKCCFNKLQPLFQREKRFYNFTFSYENLFEEINVSPLLLESFIIVADRQNFILNCASFKKCSGLKRLLLVRTSCELENSNFKVATIYMTHLSAFRNPHFPLLSHLMQVLIRHGKVRLLKLFDVCLSWEHVHFEPKHYHNSQLYAHLQFAMNEIATRRVIIEITLILHQLHIQATKL